MKPASLLAAVLLALIAVGHLLRLVFRIVVVAGGVTIPMWVSVVGVLLFATVAVLLRRETRGRAQQGAS